MMLPVLSSTPCALDLTLAGSQVRFAQPIKYTSGPTSLLNDGTNYFNKLTAPNFAARDMALAIDVRSHGKVASTPGRRFGQLPPFPLKTKIRQPNEVPCNDVKQIANEFETSPLSDVIYTLKENSVILEGSNGSHSAKLSVLSGHSGRQLRPHSLPSNEKLIVKTFIPSVIHVSSRASDNSLSKDTVTNESVLGDLKVSTADMLTRIISAEKRENSASVMTQLSATGVHRKKKERKAKKRSLKSANKHRSASHKVEHDVEPSIDQFGDSLQQTVSPLEAQCSTFKVVNPLPKMTKYKTRETSISSTDASPDSATRKSVAVQRTKNSTNKKEEVIRLTKVFLSDKQSGVLKELGFEFPCAPPATPMPVLHEQYEFVASLNDIRSQRALKNHLEVMEKAVKKKERVEHDERVKQDKQNFKEQEKLKHKRQRLEIYALNKVMTDLEHNNFQQFCLESGILCIL